MPINMQSPIFQNLPPLTQQKYLPTICPYNVASCVHYRGKYLWKVISCNNLYTSNAYNSTELHMPILPLHVAFFF